jgi:hypothetical protein
MAKSASRYINKQGRGPIENNRPSRAFSAFGWEAAP